MAQGHDPHPVGLFVKEQVIGKSFKVRVPPATRVEVEAFWMGVHTEAGILELRPKIVAE